MPFKSKLLLLIPLVLILNIWIYFTAHLTETAENIFAECARNSGRTSAAINLLLLLLIGHFGLKSNYQDKFKFDFFRLLITAFTLNHLIHLFFVYQNFNLQAMNLSVSDNLQGFFTFVSLIAIPVVVYSSNKLNKALYSILLIYFFNTTYFIGISFYGRYKPGIDEAYLHRIGVLIMILALLYLTYRVLKEISTEVKTQ